MVPIVIGLKKKNNFIIIFGIFNTLLFLFASIFYFYSNKIFRGISNSESLSKLLIYYKIIFFILPFFNSFYLSISNICCNFNPRREGKALIFINNIFIGGSGTFTFGLSKLFEKSNIWNRIKYFLFGIIQIAGTVFIIMSIDEYYSKYLALLIIGIICHAFSFITGILSCFEPEDKFIVNITESESEKDSKLKES